MPPIRLGSIVLSLAAVTLLAASAVAETPPVPTLRDIHYGPHARQVVDFYRAPADHPTPLLYFIHGGGWMGGDKNDSAPFIGCLKAGISVVSIEYRLIADGLAAHVSPPVAVCLEDSVRALQFVRIKAGEWNIDPQRIAGCGGSAGACTVLRLAYHRDFADPASADPIARQSTRLRCVVAFVPQTSLDPREMREWLPNIDYGHQAFGLPSFEAFLAQREQWLPSILDYSPYALVTRDAPPTYLFNDHPPALGQPADDATHAAAFSLQLATKLRSLGVECEFNYPGAPDLKHPDITAYLLENLQGAAP